jgi:hypothetical protein
MSDLAPYPEAESKPEPADEVISEATEEPRVEDETKDDRPRP